MNAPIKSTHSRPAAHPLPAPGSAHGMKLKAPLRAAIWQAMAEYEARKAVEIREAALLQWACSTNRNEG